MRIDAAKLRQPDRCRQVERGVIDGACSDHALCEHSSGDEVIFRHAYELRYSPEPVNCIRPRFECIDKHNCAGGPWTGFLRLGIR